MLSDLREYLEKELGVSIRESELVRALIVYGYENREDLRRYMRKVIIEGI